jgi:5'-3' exoribonuclease 1
MGIPSYFAYIVKNHAEIIKKISNNINILNISNFYLDCNSIIYDAYAKLDPHILNEHTGTTIIQNVICKIDEYLSIIQPSKNVIIAFDGVAPIAKLKQQRERRYKSWFQTNAINNSISNGTSKSNTWDKTAITPGTIFMHQLNTRVTEYYRLNNPKKLNIIVSGSNQVGEGEHKIFQYIRENPEQHFNDETIIYGLDSDLIMLAINHLNYCRNIYLFRETPHFIQSINDTLEPNENYYLDIGELANNLVYYMTTETSNMSVKRTHDYILLCFLLGNDFLPHFPALNIRKEGISRLLNAYKLTLGYNDELLYDSINHRVNWHNFKKMVEFLAKQENEWMIIENSQRSRMEKQYITKLENNEICVEEQFNLIPIYNRDIEKYINPIKPNWQHRYYKSLFSNNRYNKREISINYLEGIEWTMKYYTTYKIDWNWKYKFNYPPLLEDLYKYIPNNIYNFINIENQCEISEMVQLCYVLPRNSSHLLNNTLAQKLIEEFPEWYSLDQTFVWSYCKYMWESHLIAQDLDINHFIDVVNYYK